MPQLLQLCTNSFISVTGSWVYVTELDIVVMGDSDFVDSTSKLGLFVQIDSIAIDISSAMEASEPQKHEHFSIR